MTSFIGDGGVHQIPPAVVAQEAQQRVAQLRTSFANLAHQITHDVVLAILSALGLTPAQIAQLLHAVAGFEAFLSNPVGYIQKYILPQGSPSSPQSNPISQLYTALTNGLHGLLPPVINNNDGTFAALGSSIVNNADGTLSYLGGEAHSFINNLDGTFSTFAGAVQQGFQGLEQQATSFVTGLAGWTGHFAAAFSGASAPAAATPAQAFSAAQGVYATTATNNQNIGGMAGISVATLNAALQRSAVGAGGGSSGTNATLNFANDANQSSMSGIFSASTATFSSSGTDNPTTNIALFPTFPALSRVTEMGITSGVAAWQSSTTSGYDFEYYSTSATTTDYQIVSMNLANSPTHPGTVALIGRSNSTMGTCVVGFLTGGSAYLGCFVGGSWTLFDGPVSHTPVAGGLYELVCGVNATSNLYGYQFLVNGTSIISLTDSSHISQVGSGQRFAGLGQALYSNGAGTTYTPPIVSQWGLADNQPPAQIGSGFRAYRAATTSGGSLGTSPSLLPTSFYDTVQWNTGDLTWTSSSSSLKISVAGWYGVTLTVTASATATSAISAVLFHNGAAVEQATTIGVGSGTTAQNQGSFIVYCAANDTLQPGIAYASGSGFGLPGDANGLTAYFQVALMNCGTLS